MAKAADQSLSNFHARVQEHYAGFKLTDEQEEAIVRLTMSVYDSRNEILLKHLIPLVGLD